MSNVQQQRMVVEQLRREASIKRISVSQAVEDIKVRMGMSGVISTFQLENIQTTTNYKQFMLQTN